MLPILVDGPAVEPVDPAAIRAHLRLDQDDEDELVAGLVRAARLLVEASARRILVASRWRIVMDRWPSGRIVHLPLSPLLAVARVAVTVAPGQEIEVPPERFEADPASDPPRVVVSAAAPEPGVARGGVALEVLAGYGAAASDVPEPLRLAVKMLVARWFENRGDLVGEQALPADVLALVAPYRRARL